jgi:predicted porin
MTDRKASKRWAVVFTGLLAAAGYAGQTLAEDTSDQALKDQALKDQVRALQKQVDELSKKVNGDKSGSTEAPRTAVEQSPSPNRAVIAKEAEAAPKTAGPPPITWNGITLYGTIDIGVAHLSHGSPLSQTYTAGLPFVLQSFSNHPITSLAPGGLSQSKVGLSGVEPLGFGDLKGIFKLETGIDPTSGRLTDGPRSLVDNNGRANNARITAGDSSRAGQPFQGGAYAGIGSNTFGTLTFGRQNTLMADDLLKYDPQLQSNAFSPIGYSGTSGGLGDTEDKALDDSIKYNFAYGHARVAVLYQFGSRGVIPEGAESFDIGADYAGLSVDALYGKVRGAVAAASLTAAQNATAPGTLAGTISDNTSYAFMANYIWQPIKVYAGYQHIKFANPEDPLPAGTVTIGNYVLSTVNNTAFTINKILEYSWLGVRYSVTSKFDLTTAYYHFKQNSYAANHCSDASAGSCSGLFHEASFVADYRWTRRFDTYVGVNYSDGSDGLASGFIYHQDWAQMVGVRFNF